MTPELQAYYTRRLSMMGDEAWKDLMDDVAKMLEATNSLDGVQDEKALHFKRGEISMMRWLLAIKEITELAYVELKEEDAETVA
jgi:hypothetical protein